MIKKIFLLLSLISISSCAIGASELKVTYPDSQEFLVEKTQVNEVSTSIDKDINLSIKWVGNGYPIATAKGVTGLKSRFVIPYTRLTSLVNIKIVNNSDKYIDLNADDITLNYTDNKVKPLNIDFFKTRWPSFSVKTQEMLIDRSIAIGEVVRTIVRSEKIAPKTTYQGYLPFLKVPQSAKELELLTSFKVDNQIKDANFRFIRK